MEMNKRELFLGFATSFLAASMPLKSAEAFLSPIIPKEIVNPAAGDVMELIRQAIQRAAVATLFKPNVDVTRSKFHNQVDMFLSDMKNNEGIYDYKVICDESNNPPEIVDNHSLIANVLVRPGPEPRYINFVAGAILDDVKITDIEL